MTERNTALALPDEQTFRRDIEAINRFQQIVHQTMVVGQDFGVIPGTTGNKPTLLKPGAEKIAKLLGLADTYEIIDRQEEWSIGFFRYIVRCRLSSINNDTVISEGLGECNSMESKYRWRWLGERDLPEGTDKTKLVKQERRSKTGGHWFVYRLENEDIYSQVNTILKMAKKRALVDAALSAGRLSNVFTQDIEDMSDMAKDEVIEKPAEKPPGPTPIAPEKSKSESLSTEVEESVGELDFDAATLIDNLKKIGRTEKSVKTHLGNFYKVDTTGTIIEVVARLSQAQKQNFFDEIDKRLKEIEG